MSNKPQSKGTMRSLADMPKPIIVLEGVGIILLIIVLLATNDYITLPEPLMQPGGDREHDYGRHWLFGARNGQYCLASNSWPEFFGH